MSSLMVLFVDSYSIMQLVSVLSSCGNSLMYTCAMWIT